MITLGLRAQIIKNALCALLVLMVVQAAMAANPVGYFYYGSVKYTINEGTQTVTATGFEPNKDTPTTLIIPNYAWDEDGTAYAVTAIGKQAFSNSQDVKRVVIGDNVKTIAWNAFERFGEGADNPTLVIGKHVESCDEFAFPYFGYKGDKPFTVIMRDENPTAVRLTQVANISKAKNTTIYVKDEAVYNRFKADAYWENFDGHNGNTYNYPFPSEVTVKAGLWQTAVFPEALTQEQMETWFGHGTLVARLSEDQYKWENEQELVVRFNLKEGVDRLEPVLIKPANAESNYVSEVAYGVDSESGNPVVTMTEAQHQVRVNMIGACHDDYNLDFGQIYLRNESGRMQFFSADNAESDPNAKSDVWVKRGKCYFEMRDQGDNLLYDIPVSYDVQQSTTAIRDLQRDQQHQRQGVYSLTGQYEGTTLEGLSRGIHIVNGRKVVVK